MKFRVDLVKSLFDFWNVRGKFHRLSKIAISKIIIIELILIGFISGGYYYLRYRLQMNNLMKMKESNIRLVDNINREIETKQSQLSAVTARYWALCGLFNRTEQIPKLLDHITKNCKRYGIEFVSLTPSLEQSSTKYSKGHATVKLKGGFIDFVRFLRSLETLNEPINICSLQLFSSEEMYPKLNITFQIETYSVNESVNKKNLATRKNPL